MAEIVCDKCGVIITNGKFAIKSRVLTKDENGDDVTEQYFECPVCGSHYVILIQNRHLKVTTQKRRQIQISIWAAEKLRNHKKAQAMKEKERELAEDMNKQAHALKEKYKEYIREDGREKGDA